MLIEAALAGVAVLDHRAARQVFALVGVDADAAAGGGGARDEQGGQGGAAHRRRLYPYRSADGADLVVSIRDMKLTSVRFCSVLALSLSAAVPLGLVGCGGAQTTGTGTGGGGSGSGGGGAAGAADLTLTLDSRPIAGTVFTPEAIGRPALPQVQPKKKLTLDRHRAELLVAKPDELEIKAQVLATRLFTDSRAETDKGNADAAKALLAEAYKVLQDVRGKTTGKTDVITLRMLGFHAFTQQDLPGAASVFDELNTRFANDLAAPEFREYAAWAALRQHNYASAQAALGSFAPSVAPAGTADDVAIVMAETAYIAAWARWGTNTAGAFDAIRAAYAGWKSAGSRSAVEADLMLIAARSGAPVADAISSLVAGVAPEALPKALSSLSNAYAGAGRFADASTIIDQAVKAGGATLPPADVAKLRFSQAQYAMRLGKPADAAAAAKVAIDAAPAGAVKTDLAAGALGLAKLFHTIYATALDESYYPPAKALYLVAAGAGQAEAEALTGQLDQTKTNSKTGSGKHDIAVVGPLVAMRELDIVACYEQALLAEPTLAGTLQLTLDVAATGTVAGATTTPPGGLTGLAAVGACVEQHARGWQLPARSMPGQTAISGTFTLTVKP